MQFELSTIQYIQQPAYMQHHIKLTCNTLFASFSAVDAPSTPVIESEVFPVRQCLQYVKNRNCRI